MNDLQKTVADFLKARHIAGAKLAVGVSGGRDSMCLLHAVINCGAADKKDVTVVHVNHNLRKTAMRDEQFVRRYCADNGLNLRAVSVDVTGMCRKYGFTVEQAARNLRYEVFYGLINSGEAETVLTAHHALDNAESVLMHLLRGSGLDGLKPMSSPFISRPFIDVYPFELDAYAAKNGIEYVTDETNFEQDADRNFLRLSVLPLIESRYRGAVRAINELSRESGEICDLLDAETDLSRIRYDRGAYIIPFDLLSGALGARYVRGALKHFSLTDVTRAQVRSVVALGAARSGARAELSNGVVAAREYDGVALFIPREVYDGAVPFCEGANFIDGLAIDASLSDAQPESVRGGAVDLDKLFGAELRFRRDGDHFTPIGGVRKKLARYFIDEKVPKRVRDRTPLICRGSDVLVIVGIQIADEVKQTRATVRRGVVRMRY